MIIESVAKKSGLPSTIASGASLRGRPPKPGGRTPQVEVQRAYHARLAAAGKVVKIVDAAALSPAPGHIPDFDPARNGIYERAMFEKMRDGMHNALL
jgi:hypothetical protein